MKVSSLVPLEVANSAPSVEVFRPQPGSAALRRRIHDIEELEPDQ